jgi:hypothetical protein
MMHGLAAKAASNVVVSCRLHQIQRRALAEGASVLFCCVVSDVPGTVGTIMHRSFRMASDGGEKAANDGHRA